MPADGTGEVHKEMGRGAACLLLRQDGQEVYSPQHPRVPPSFPGNVYSLSSRCQIAGDGGRREVQKAPCSARKPVQLSGVLGACGSALWRLVWMVEGLVK